MGFFYEPGPLAPLDPAIVPAERFDGTIETVVAPASAQLTLAEGFTAVRLSEMAGAGVPDVDGETVTVLRPLYDEVQYQLRTEHELSPSATTSAVVGALGDTDRVRADLPSEDSSWQPPPVPGEGTTNPVETPEPGERPRI